MDEEKKMKYILLLSLAVIYTSCLDATGSGSSEDSPDTPENDISQDSSDITQSYIDSLQTIIDEESPSTSSQLDQLSSEDFVVSQTSPSSSSQTQDTSETNSSMTYSSSEQLSSSSIDYNGELTIPNPSFEDNVPQISKCLNLTDSTISPTVAIDLCNWGDSLISVDRTLGDGGIFGMDQVEPHLQCSGTTDLLPNAPGLAPSAPAAHGIWYIGLVCDDRNFPASESMATKLSSPLVAGSAYEFRVSLMTLGSGYWNGQIENPGRLFLIGRMKQDACTSVSNHQQVLWDSGTVTNTSWEDYQVTFTSNEAWEYLYISMSDGTQCKYNESNILIDNFSSFKSVH